MGSLCRSLEGCKELREKPFLLLWADVPSFLIHPAAAALDGRLPGDRRFLFGPEGRGLEFQR